ncbi:MAG: lytic transglycosylase domain-containing protein [Sphingomonadales bacterium]
MYPTTIDERWSRSTQGIVGAALREASARSGMDFGYLLGQARIESGLNPTAEAGTSSATGLFQFTEQTWLATVKKHGASYGLDWAAAAIRQDARGRYHVADGAMRRAVLDLRKDAQASAAMAAEFASDNQQYLEARLGRPAQSVDLYLAHFLGPGGAEKFLKAHDVDPSASAAAFFPAAARANRGVFYSRDGTPRSLEEVRSRFAAKLGDTGAPLPDRPLDRPAAIEMAARERPIPTPSAEYARLAYLMLARLGG